MIGNVKPCQYSNISSIAYMMDIMYTDNTAEQMQINLPLKQPRHEVNMFDYISLPRSGTVHLHGNVASEFQITYFIVHEILPGNHADWNGKARLNTTQ